MTGLEFKAWLDGFTEAMGNKPPTKEQWAKIRKRAAEICDSNYRWVWPYYTASSTYTPSAPQTTCTSYYAVGKQEAMQ